MPEMPMTPSPIPIVAPSLIDISAQTAVIPVSQATAVTRFDLAAAGLSSGPGL